MVLGRRIKGFGFEINCHCKGRSESLKVCYAWSKFNQTCISDWSRVRAYIALVSTLHKKLRILNILNFFV